MQGQRPTATYSSVKTCSHSTVSLLLFRHTYKHIFRDLDKRYTTVLQETLMRLNEVLLWYQPNEASAQSETCLMCHSWNIKLNQGFHLFFWFLKNFFCGENVVMLTKYLHHWHMIPVIRSPPTALNAATVLNPIISTSCFITPCNVYVYDQSKRSRCNKKSLWNSCCRGLLHKWDK